MDIVHLLLIVSIIKLILQCVVIAIKLYISP